MQPSPRAEIQRYVEDPDFMYQDFARRGAPSEIPTFRAQVCCLADWLFVCEWFNRNCRFGESADTC